MVGRKKFIDALFDNIRNKDLKGSHVPSITPSDIGLEGIEATDDSEGIISNNDEYTEAVKRQIVMNEQISTSLISDIYVCEITTEEFNILDAELCSLWGGK